MIKNLHRLDKLSFTKLKTTALLSSAFLLLSGYATAQYKIDPRFEELIQAEKTLSKTEISNLDQYKQLGTSKIIQPNGTIEELFQVIIHTKEAKKLQDEGYLIQSISKDFATALLSLNQIKDLGKRDEVNVINATDFSYSENLVPRNDSGAELLHKGTLNNTNYTGKGILVGVLDSGIDYTHPDFRDPNDPTKSRILSIWDQTINPITGESSPNIFSTGNYGVEYTQVHINDEIDGSPANYVRQKDTNTHGTHVAGTVAGNGMGMPGKLYKGLAPEADIVIVKAGDGTFSNTNVINGLEYFKYVANKLGKPIVVNMSLGGQSTPHEGNAPHEIKINEFTSSGPGRVVVMSAGNEGNGNIHQQIQLAPTEKKTIKISVSEAATNSTALNIFSLITYNKGSLNSENIIARLKLPDGTILTAEPGKTTTHSIPNTQGTGNTSLSLYNYISTSYQKRYIEIRASRSLNTIKTAGIYELEIENTSSQNLTIDGWIYNKDVTTTLPDGDNNYTVGSPGTANNAITVANYIGQSIIPNRSSNYSYSYYYNLPTQDLNTSSSKGPRADEVRKPDIAAVGTYVISARSSHNSASSSIDPNQYYSQKNGTSMSAPVVAGSIALLLQANNNLTYQEIKTLLTKNTNKDIFTTNDYTNGFGYGKLNIYKAVSETVNILNNNTSCPTSNFMMLGYDNLSESYSTTNTPSAYYYNIGNTTAQNTGRLAVKYTPTTVGKLQSLYVFTGNENFDKTKKVPFVIELRKVKEDGTVGDLIGTKTIPDVQEFGNFEWTNFDVSELDYKTTVGEDFYVVIYADGFAYRLFFDKTNIDGRTYFSSDDGKTFKVSTTLDAKVRAIIYDNEPGVKQLATTNKSATLNTKMGYNYFVNGCEMITRVESSGAAPITGNTTAKAWIDSSLQEFVSRRIEVNTENNNNTSTGKVTLFYTQADFDQFNKNNTKQLPTSPTDEENKKNVIVHYFAGKSKDDTGNPNSYENSVINTPVKAENIKWNNTYNYWEITVDAIGFGGYLLSSNASLANLENSLSQLTLYPNPVVNELSINLPTNVKEAQVKIVNVAGQNVITTQIKQSNHKINVNHLSRGVYIVEIKTDKGTITKKIIKN